MNYAISPLVEFEILLMLSSDNKTSNFTLPELRVFSYLIEKHKEGAELSGMEEDLLLHIENYLRLNIHPDNNSLKIKVLLKEAELITEEEKLICDQFGLFQEIDGNRFYPVKNKRDSEQAERARKELNGILTQIDGSK